MARNQANETFALTSFLYGGNADYIEDLHARYETDPSSVPAEWSDFFKELKDDRDDVIKSAEGPSWERANWPIAANGDLDDGEPGGGHFLHDGFFSICR